MNPDVSNEQNNKDNLNATLYTNSNGESTVKKTAVNIKQEKNNPDTKKIIIEKQVNVIHKEAITLNPIEMELMNEIYRTTAMGIQSIDAINKDICLRELKDELERELASYKKMHTKAVDFMIEQGIEPIKTNPIAKALQWSSVKVTAMANRSTSHIAEMMINGTTMGVITMHKAINKFGGNAKLGTLANDIISFMRSSIDNLAKFL